MLFNQIIFFIYTGYVILIMNYLFLVPVTLFSKNNYSLIKECKTMHASFLVNNFFYIMKMNMYLSIQDKIDVTNTDKIDIIMCNHISIFDYLILIVLLKELGIDYYNFTFKNGLNKGLGLYMIHCDTDILVNRDWSSDKDNIDKQLDKIKPLNKKQVIIIYPEGNRINYERLLTSQKYSQDNDLPIYNNLLTPKVKGIWYIINKLKSENKLGSVWDISLIRPNYITNPPNKKLLNNTQNWLDLVYKKFDDYYVIINKVKYPEYYKDYDKFKSWFYSYWDYKDIQMTNYKKYDYYKINDDNKYSIKNIKTDYIIIFILLFVSIYLLSHKEGRKIFLFLFILSYILIYTRPKIYTQPKIMKNIEK